MANVANDILELIGSKIGKGQGQLKFSDPLDQLGLDSLEVVSLTFTIEEKYVVEIPFNANSDIEAKTVADLIHTVEQLVAAKAQPA